ncbi:MAG: D-cysteine desulfhydrase family protein [Anaerolineaceae bacterium]|jgi:D-cysteine desulfhydrase family pyridoxal phosphate-dependent enzyme|nr:D-cysteine desulfhydrase family protein [Anaerolineaceae bacterium]
MIERLTLAHLPTPIEALPHLSGYLNGPQLFIKRDDLTGLGMGGNKTRKLEYLAADALAKGAKTLISTGAVQSNHCRQVAATAAKLGLGCQLILAGAEPAEAQGNLLLDNLFGAQLFYTTKANRDQELQMRFVQAKQDGLKPYLIPYGGSNPIGALGYLNAMHELSEQNLQPDWIVFASSSGGTQAGLILGAHITGFKGKILGISIEHDRAHFSAQISDLVNQTAESLGYDWSVTPQEVLINDAYCQAGYGVLTSAEIEAVRMFASKQGILLDPVYTGRAAAGLIDLIRNNFFKPEENILFWHTGGTPALFAEPYSQGLMQE